MSGPVKDVAMRLDGERVVIEHDCNGPSGDRFDDNEGNA